MRRICAVDLGDLSWQEAYALQKCQEARRKAGDGDDTLFFVNHPHVITMGRNGHERNLLASPEQLRSKGIDYEETNRGGDITYHGPGQIVGYPIVDLNSWKRDVRAYVRGVEEVLIRTLDGYGIRAERISGMTGVWVEGAKVAAIGIHMSRWVSSHGFALNHNTDLSYFQYIVPCGLTKPVTSMEKLGVVAERGDVMCRIAEQFRQVFEFEILEWHTASGSEREKQQ